MKKIEENKLLFILVYSFATGLMGVILYPLFDLLFCKFFTNTEFVYSVSTHILSPISFGIVFSVVYSTIKFNRK